AGDTLDPSVGTAAEQSLHDVFVGFYCHVPEHMLQIEHVKGTDFSRDELLATIGRMPVAADDALVVYVFSHGQYDQKGHYFVDRRGKSPIYRADLLAAMEKKGARFRALISDSCNMYLPTGKIGDVYAAPSFAPAEKLSPLHARLFFGHQGLLDVNSSSKDQSALCIPGVGGLFSMALSLPYTDEMLDQFYEAEIQKGSRLGNTLKTISFVPGIFFSGNDQSRSWDEVLNYCQNQLDTTFLPLYQSLSVTQRIVRISMPSPAPIPPGVSSGGGGNSDGGGGWGGGPQPGSFPPGTVVTLQPGDVILSVNGQAIGGTSDYWNAVKSSPTEMHFTLQSAGDGNVYHLRTSLLDRSADSRFGVDGADMAGRGGVLVRSVRRGYPGSRCVVE
ncbi:MAG: hypothetical protein ACYC6Y_21000, partial [Thermoguttaceae bacterium]